MKAELPVVGRGFAVDRGTLSRVLCSWPIFAILRAPREPSTLRRRVVSSSVEH